MKIHLKSKYSQNTSACGLNLPMPQFHPTSRRELNKVTCGACQRTRRYKNLLDLNLEYDPIK